MLSLIFCLAVFHDVHTGVCLATDTIHTGLEIFFFEVLFFIFTVGLNPVAGRGG